MIFTNALALVLALAPTALLAAPTKVLASRSLPIQVLKALEDGACDLSKAAMPAAPTPLPAVGAGFKLAHVAIGRGTQNYTCTNLAPTDAPVQVGAIATLFNATCSAVRAPNVLADVTNLALNYAVPTTEIAQHLLSGHHEFTKATEAKASVPRFELNTDLHKYGYIEAKKNGSSNAPTTASHGTNGLGSVAWLKLVATEGDLKEVYRINTAGGVAPKTCEGITGDFTVPYAAEYWFYA